MCIERNNLDSVLMLNLFGQSYINQSYQSAHYKVIMNLIKQQTQYTFEQTYYQPFDMFAKSTTLFVPFVKERDSMGRLIKKQNTSQKILRRSQNQQKTAEKDKDRILEADQRLEYKMQKYFKHASVANLINPPKPKKSKRTIIHLVQMLSQPFETTKTIKRPSTTASKQQQSSVRPFTHTEILHKTQSVSLSSPKKDNLFIKRANSTTLPFRKAVQKQTRSISPESSSKRNTYNEPRIKLLENQNKYPQLSRVRKMQQLQIKLHTDFEQRHGHFLDKIIKSKQLAFQVRVGLDKIDELC